MSSTIGERLHRRLLAEGGYIYTRRDGRKTVHFNSGRRPTKELVEALKKYHGELSKFIDREHERIIAGWRRLRKIDGPPR